MSTVTGAVGVLRTAIASSGPEPWLSRSRSPVWRAAAFGRARRLAGRTGDRFDGQVRHDRPQDGCRRDTAGHAGAGRRTRRGRSRTRLRRRRCRRRAVRCCWPGTRTRANAAAAREVAARVGADRRPDLHGSLCGGQQCRRRRGRDDRVRPVRPGGRGRRFRRGRRTSSARSTRAGRWPGTGGSGRSARAGRAWCSATRSPPSCWNPAARAGPSAGLLAGWGRGRRRLPRVPAATGRRRAGAGDHRGARTRRRRARGGRLRQRERHRHGVQRQRRSRRRCTRRSARTSGRIPVSSTKSAHGHALEASGLLELVVTVLRAAVPASCR